MKSYTFHFKNIKKRALSMVLAGSMMLSAMPAQIFAAGARSATEPSPGITWSEEIHAHANCGTGTVYTGAEVDTFEELQDKLIGRR